MDQLTNIHNLFVGDDDDQPDDLCFVLMDVKRMNASKAVNKVYRLLVSDAYGQTNLTHELPVGEFIGANCKPGRILCIPRGSWQWTTLPSEGKTIQITDPYIQCENPAPHVTPRRHYGIGPNRSQLPYWSDSVLDDSNDSAEKASSEEDDSVASSISSDINPPTTKSVRALSHMFEYDSEKTQTYRYYFKQPRKFVGSYKAYDALELQTDQLFVRIGSAHMHKTLKTVIVLAIYRNLHGHPFVLAMDERKVVHKIAPKKLSPELETKSMTLVQVAKWQYLVSRYLQSEDGEQQATQSDQLPDDVIEPPTAAVPPPNNLNPPSNASNQFEQLYEAVQSISTTVVDLQRKLEASEMRTIADTPQKAATNETNNNVNSIDTQTVPKAPVTPIKEPVTADDLAKIISTSIKKALKVRRRYSSLSSSDSSSSETHRYRKYKKKRSRRH